ncbi:MAG: hypothetical protein AABW54_00740 [Candidatus Micrarchaeota archaeon]
MRGQAALEVAAIVAFAVLLLLLSQVRVVQESVRLQELAAGGEAEGLASRLSVAVVSAAAYDGFATVVQMPASLRGEPYNVAFTNASVIVSWNPDGVERSAYASHGFVDVRNASGASAFTIGPSTITIGSDGGEVIVS